MHDLHEPLCSQQVSLVNLLQLSHLPPSEKACDAKTVHVPAMHRPRLFILDRSSAIVLYCKVAPPPHTFHEPPPSRPHAIGPRTARLPPHTHPPQRLPHLQLLPLLLLPLLPLLPLLLLLLTPALLLRPPALLQ